MEDIRKASAFNPEKPIYRTGLGLFFPVISPVQGRILEWKHVDNDWVDKRDLLCRIESVEIPGDVREVNSPAMGQLHILAGEGATVQEGTAFAGTELEDYLLEGDRYYSLHKDGPPNLRKPTKPNLHKGECQHPSGLRPANPTVIVYTTVYGHWMRAETFVSQTVAEESRGSALVSLTLAVVSCIQALLSMPVMLL